MRRVATGITLAALVGAMLAGPATAADTENWVFDACLTVEGQQDALYAFGDTDEAVAEEVMAGNADVIGAGGSCGRQRKPTVAVPVEGLVDIGRARWSELVFRDGGRKLDVYFSAGVPSCKALDRVEVTVGEAGLDVGVFVGSYPPAEGMACPAVLHSWVTTVDLTDPIAFGSSRERDEAWREWQDEVREIKLAAIHQLADVMPGTIRFVTDELGREDFRFTSEGRAYALQYFDDPETTRDTLVNYLLEREGLKPRYPATPGQEPFSEEWLELGQVTVEDGGDSWVADCDFVKEDKCRGAAETFVDNLSRSNRAVRESSGGEISIERRSACPKMPRGFIRSACWQATAEGPDGPVCMVLAKMSKGFIEKSGSELGFGQVGGDLLAGLAGDPPKGWPTCE